MTRTPILAGNWKMYKTVTESVEFVQALVPLLEPFSGVERVVCPTFVALASVSAALQGSPVKVGSQQIHWEQEGAFTSQISPKMLQGLVEYAIIGHSECRAYLNETDETVNKKAKAALAAGIKPIVAVGESEAQYDAGITNTVVETQIKAALNGINGEDMPKVVIAYEPIWAIGTGKNATPDTAQAVIGMIRSVLRGLYGNTVAEVVRIQYGGSVKPANMADYMRQPDIDGGLVGGASLKLQDFTDLVRITQEVAQG